MKKNCLFFFLSSINQFALGEASVCDKKFNTLTLDNQRRIIHVGDINHDGYDDWVEYNQKPFDEIVNNIPSSESSKFVYVVMGPWPGNSRTMVEFDLSNEPVKRVKKGDLNNDGFEDLVFSAYWRNEAAVYFGPFDGNAKSKQQSLSIVRPTGPDLFIGLLEHFSKDFLIADLDSDQINDLLLPAPSYGEVGYSASRDIIGFAGPLKPGVANTGDRFVQDLRPEANIYPDFTFRHVDRISPWVGYVHNFSRPKITFNKNGEKVISIANQHTQTMFKLPLARGLHIVRRGEQKYFPGVDVNRDGIEDRYEYDKSSVELSNGITLNPIFNLDQPNLSWSIEEVNQNDDLLDELILYRYNYDIERNGFRYKVLPLPKSLNRSINDNDLLSLPHASGFIPGLENAFPQESDLDGNGKIDIIIGADLHFCK